MVTDILKLCQDELRDNHPGQRDNYKYPTSYGFLLSNGCNVFEKLDIDSYHDEACIGSLNSYTDTPNQKYNQQLKKACYIWHQATDTEQNREYLSYILDKNISPWKRLLASQPDQDLDFVFRYGYVLLDLSFPANFLSNFLVAFRQSYEKPDIVQLWHELVSDGVLPGTAAILMSTVSTSYKDKETPIIMTADRGHTPFSVSTSGLDTFHRVNTGTVNDNHLSSNLFITDTRYGSMNWIWDSSDSNGELYEELVSSTKGTALLRKNKGNVVNRIFGKGEVSKEKVPILYDDYRQFGLFVDKLDLALKK